MVNVADGKRRRMNYDLQALRADIFGGATTMVIALPVALGFGIASGMGAAAGLYGAIALGFFASVLGGTRGLISAPTPAMTVAMAVVVTNYASTLGEALTVVILAGFIQVLLGLSRIGRFVVYTPYVVVSGFMTGIGVVFVLNQILPFMGQPIAPGASLNALRGLPEAASTFNVSAFVIAATTLVIAFLWPRRLSRLVPGPLAALVAGSAVGIFWLNDVPVIGDVPTSLPEVRLGLPVAAFLLKAVEPAFLLALLGSVSSLLTSLFADSLTGARHNPNRELIGQGIGNMAAGLFGGIPGAGAPALTTVNIRCGAQTGVSGALYALFSLAVVMGLGRYLEPIPVAALAGLLVKLGWDLIDWRILFRLHRIGPEHYVVMLMTLILTVFVDLLTGVALGLIAAGMAHALQLERLELDSVVSVPLLDRTFFDGLEAGTGADRFDARIGLVALRGSFTVASSHKLVEVIGADIKDHEVVVFDFSGASYVDLSAAKVIGQLIVVADEAGTSCIVMGLTGSIAETLDSLSILRNVPKNRIVGTMEEARQVANELLRRQG